MKIIIEIPCDEYNAIYLAEELKEEVEKLLNDKEFIIKVER